MPNIPTEVLSEYSKLTSGKGFSSSQVRQALYEVDGGVTRASRSSADSFISKVLKSLSGREVISGNDLVRAAEDAGMSVQRADRLKRIVSNPGIVNDGLARGLLSQRGLSTELAPELVDQATRAGSRALGKVGKRGLLGLGGLLGGVAKAAGSELFGVAGDVLQGTPPGAPGGLSGGELYEGPLGRELLEKEGMSFEERWGEQISDELVPSDEKLRSEEGEIQAAMTTASPSSGNSIIFQSIAALLGRR